MNDRDHLRLTTATVETVNGRVLGTGFLLLEQCVLTCWHVVENTLAENLCVRFPWSDGEDVFRVDAITPGGGGIDLALLRIVDQPRIAPVPPGEVEEEVEFFSWGYPVIHDTKGITRCEGGLSGYGTVNSLTRDKGQDILVLDTRSVNPGSSGTPIAQTAPLRIIGVVTTKLTQVDNALALPLSSALDYINESSESQGICGGLSNIQSLSAASTAELGQPRLHWFSRARRPSAIFVDRQESLLNLDQLLAATDRVAVQAAVEGLAGIGKTELALHYVARFCDPVRFPGGLIWLDADTDLTTQWLTLASEQQLPLTGGDDKTRENEVLRWLGNQPRMLLVLDNATSWRDLQPHLPPAESGHVVLVTTRVHEFAGAQFHHQELGILSPAGSRELLQELMGARAEHHPDEVEQVADALGGHALALEVAGAYLRRYSHVNVDDFLSRVVSEEFRLSGAVRDEVAYGTTFALMMDEVRASLSDGQGADVLLAMAGLYGEAPAPLSLLQETWQSLEREAFDEVFGVLCDLHLVDYEATRQEWTTHRLVRARAREWLEQLADQAPAREGHAGAFNEALGKLDDYSFADFGRLEPHVREVFRWGTTIAPVGDVLSRSGPFMQRLGRFAEARVWTETALQIALEVYDENNPGVANLRSNLAIILHALGDLEGAKRETETALQIDLEVYDENHPDVAIRRSNLAVILHALGDIDGAKRETETALQIVLEVNGENHPNVASLRSNLALILKDLGDLEGAKREAETALQIDLEVYDENHPRVANDRSSLAVILHALGDLESAKRETETALQVELEVYDENHPRVAELRSNLAQILQDLGDIDGAKRETETALQIDLEVYDENHPTVATDRSNLAMILRDFGDLDGAKRETETALQIDLEIYGENHPVVANLRSNLAVILQALGDLEGAKRETETALQIDLEVYDENHPIVAHLRSNLAQILHALGDLESARHQAQEALRIVQLQPSGSAVREGIERLWFESDLFP